MQKWYVQYNIKRFCKRYTELNKFIPLIAVFSYESVSGFETDFLSFLYLFEKTKLFCAPLRGSALADRELLKIISCLFKITKTYPFSWVEKTIGVCWVFITFFSKPYLVGTRRVPTAFDSTLC